MKCIIVDDEPLAREGIKLNMKEVPYLQLEGSFSTALSANDFLRDHPVDLMFLDIQMPGITGLEFIKILDKDILVILTTAYPEFALEGFELNVLDYLVKPIRLERFIKAVNKAKEIFDLKHPGNVQENGHLSEFIYIKSERKYLKIFFKSIRYISGMKDYVMVHTDTQRIMTAMNLKTIFEQLPRHQFARVSKSHIINVDFVESLEGEEISLGKEKIPLGKTYKDEFIDKFIKNNLLDRP